MSISKPERHHALPPRRRAHAASRIALVTVVLVSVLLAGGPRPTQAAQDAWPVIAAYIGPDMLLPFTSALGAIAGVALMFWQRIVALARRIWRLLRRDPA